MRRQIGGMLDSAITLAVCIAAMSLVMSIVLTVW